VSVDKQSGAEQPIGSRADLVDWIRGGEKPAERWKVGTEHEKIGLRLEDLARVPYEGERGLAALLLRIAEEDGWTPVLDAGNPIALEKDGASISLEPGGQLELSGAPLRTIHETCSEFHGHLALVRRVSEPLGIAWLSLGIDPRHEVPEVPQVPKERYRVMRRYLPAHGELALDMMHLTATVQANFDWSDEQDMAAKMRTAMGVTPIVSAIFANSSVAGGKASGFVSRRVHIWRHVDPDRCGLLPFVFEPDFGYARWVDWALDVPLFFVLRGGRYLPARGLSFRRFLEEGLDGERATLGDFERHLTTLFPEVRIKRVLEVRGADAVPPGLICGLPALWKGLLYDSAARDAAWRLAADWSFEAREAALEAVARRGLAAEVAGRPVLGLARELVAVAAEGLRRIGHAGRFDPDERGYLDPVREVVESGRSPGQVILERWEGEWRRSFSRLIEYARY
jgi:glutamate--cysteine ligase